MNRNYVAAAVAAALMTMTGMAVADDASTMSSTGTDTGASDTASTDSSVGSRIGNMFSGPWYVMPTLGAMYTDRQLRADDWNANYGIRIGKELSEHWDVQLGLTHSQADEDSRRYSGGRYKQTLLGIDAMYMFSRDRFRPFLLAGIGMANNNIHYNGTAGFPNADGNKNSWMANVGVGAQYDISDRIGLQADVRQVYSRSRANGGLFGSDRHDTTGNTYLNVGLIIKFGEPQKTAAVEPTPEPVAAAEPEPAPQPETKPEPPPQPAPPPAAVGPDEPAFKKVAIQAEVLFDFNKATVKDAGKQLLNSEVVQKMKDNPQVELLLITGHADRIGSEQYNQKLSERRAEAVKQYLVGQGIDAQRLHTQGKGESEPVVQCNGSKNAKTIKCLQPNRRVVLEIEAQRASEK
ncbi:OmpA-OmpF porin, OOP family [Novimethylophilus kurashikiensis]|uniref:OmpA-OmpF porin, OOP family n=1 Tax=Novimethylophilus kurashikiensis TaxID=1825523 RepID=A0A2R5FF22_9PROT|nr:OmpA family protein [Novimethylophilus kurashikiensis]GBG15041.1 OmpA-OmpF porin, OOP family [Novimethylophilus kurashikiensis]